MSAPRSAALLVAALAALAMLTHPGDAQANARKGRSEATGGAARTVVTRADKPVVTATAPGPGQAGYVHFFLLEFPDGTLDIQVGIELPDQRIAWSLPGLGATVSPFVESGTVTAGAVEYDVWHLYGIRPFPDNASMATLQSRLVERIRPWIEAKTPYCENEERRAGCMSCLGFVLRALFPARADGYPVLPPELARAGVASKYTTRELLLFLTGMLELQTRQARLQRIARLTLPDSLREDLEELVHATAAVDPAAGPQGAVPKRPGARLPKPAARDRLGARVCSSNQLQG